MSVSVGLAYVPQAADSLASESLRVPPRALLAPLRKWSATPNREKKQKRPLARAFSYFGGVDGTRTRDPRRDRPVF
jgi:hypothetical protein